jgi:hypothetical protein
MPTSGRKQSSATSIARKPARWVASALAVVVLLGGIAFSIMRLASTPQPVEAEGKTALSKAALERSRQYVGMSVEGISRVTGRPFVMRLGKDGKAEVEIELPAGVPGQTPRRRHLVD